MSTTPPPPDRPTEPLRPRHPTPPVEGRAVPPGGDTNFILARLEDSLASLRTGLMIVGVIAVLALGVGIFALASNDDASTSGGSRSGLASDARVSRVDERVDRLSGQLRDLRAGGASGLEDRVNELEQTVKTLDSADDPSQAIEDLSNRTDALESDVEQLQQSQSP